MAHISLVSFVPPDGGLHTDKSLPNGDRVPHKVPHQANHHPSLRLRGGANVQQTVRGFCPETGPWLEEFALLHEEAFNLTVTFKRDVPHAVALGSGGFGQICADCGGFQGKLEDGQHVENEFLSEDAFLHRQPQVDWVRVARGEGRARVHPTTQILIGNCDTRAGGFRLSRAWLCSEQGLGQVLLAVARPGRAQARVGGHWRLQVRVFGAVAALACHRRSGRTRAGTSCLEARYHANRCLVFVGAWGVVVYVSECGVGERVGGWVSVCWRGRSAGRDNGGVYGPGAAGGPAPLHLLRFPASRRQ